MTKRALVTSAAALLIATTVTACSSAAGGSDDDTLTIVASFYPLQFVTEQIVGDRAEVTSLVDPGVEPHDVELSASQVAAIVDADLVVYLHGFQPAVDQAVEQREDSGAIFDVAEVEPLLDASAEEEHGSAGEEAHEEEAHEHGATDPHVWLDPLRYANIADAVAEHLQEIDQEHAEEYADNAAQLRTELEALDAEYTDGLATCERREIFVSHAAFGYLTTRYDLEQIALSGLSPDQEPTPQRLAEVAALAEEHGATVIFFETLVSPEIAQTLAEEIGARVEVLDPIEGLNPDSADQSSTEAPDYFSVMRSNLSALRDALGCA